MQTDEIVREFFRFVIDIGDEIGLRDPLGIDLSTRIGSPVNLLIFLVGNSPQEHACRMATVLRKVVGIEPLRLERQKTAEWAVVDYGHTIIHYMIPEVWARYDFEDLYSECPRIFLPEPQYPRQLYVANTFVGGAVSLRRGALLTIRDGNYQPAAVSE